MTTFTEIQRIQAYLRELARQQYDTVSLPPFTLFFHPTDAFEHFSYAIPDVPAGGDLSEVLALLRGIFRRRGRVPRFEFIEAFAPALPASLHAGGFREQGRQWSMLCSPESIRTVAQVPGLVVTALEPTSPTADIRDFLMAQRQGFNPQDESQPADNEIQETRRVLQAGSWQGYLARLEDQPAGAAVLNRSIDGVSEVAGVATRPRFRRRGIGSYLVWLATHAAFERGTRTACLTAEDEAAGQIYRRIGYHPFSIMLAYIDETTPYDDLPQPP